MDLRSYNFFIKKDTFSGLRKQFKSSSQSFDKM